MEFLGLGIFGRIDVTFRSLAFKKKNHFIEVKCDSYGRL